MIAESLAFAIALLPAALHTRHDLSPLAGTDRCYDVSRTDGEELWGFDDFRVRLTDERVLPSAPDRKAHWDGEDSELEDWPSALLSWRMVEVSNSIQVLGYYRGVSLELRFAPVEGKLEGTARSVGRGQDVENPIVAVPTGCGSQSGESNGSSGLLP